jgi:tape measure domain-containing protein
MATQRELQILLSLKDEVSKQLKTVETQLTSLKPQFKQLAAVGTVGLTAVTGAIAVMVKKAGDMEALMKGLEAVAGSAEEAKIQFERLRDVAKLPGLGLTEAVQGSINLQAAGLSANQAERALMAFGNALATVGKGKAELAGVTLALQQIAAKGKISAEEINQLNERLPQIRQAMKAAFGTADTEALQKMGIGAEEFVDKITLEFEKLPKVAGGFNLSWENLQDNFFILANAIGTAFLPAAQKLLDTISPIIEKFAVWAAANPKLVIAIGATLTVIFGLIAALGTLGIAILTIGPALSAIGAAFALVGTIAGAISLPILAVIAVIGGLIAIAFLVWRNWDSIKAKLIEIWDTISSAVNDAVTAIHGVLTTGLAAITGTWNAVWGALSLVVSKAIEFVKNAIVMGLEIIKTIWNFYWQTYIDFVKGAMALILGTILLALDMLFPQWEEKLRALYDSVVLIFNQMIEGISVIMQTVSTTIINAWTALTEMLNVIITNISTMIVTTWQAITGFLIPIMTMITTTLTTAWNVIATTINTLIEGAKNDIMSAWQTIADFFKAIWDSITSTFKSAVDNITRILQPVIDMINRIESALGSFGGGAVKKAKSVTASLSEGASAAIARGKEILPFADGGIVTKPVMGLVGEAGPEAIIPLSKAGAMGGITINITGNSFMGRENIAEQIGDDIIRTLKLNLKI